jgi:nitrogen fixation/metabolism regulation signal transduction histidine kinase
VKGAAAFALSVAIRSAAIGVLVFIAVAITITKHWYATGAVILGLAALVAADIARLAQTTDRTLAQFVDGLFAEGHERPSARGPAGRLAGAIERALERLGRSRAERQRRMEYVQALIDTVAAAVLVLDEVGGIEFANRAARNRLGEAGTLDQLAALGAGAAKAISEAPPGAQIVVTLASGQRMLASVAVFVADGRRRRMVALQSLSGDLAAVELESWRGLTRILSHEMMNSLTPICSLAEGLPARLPAELAASDLADALEVIARRASGLMHFVDRYRRVADLPAPTAGPIAAEDLASRLVTLMGPLMAERGVAFEARCNPKGLVLFADPELIEQALINLLKNALDAVEGRAGGRVTLGFASIDGAAVIAVGDNGPGLAPDAAEAAFTPFFTTKAGGHGIGLSLARQIALAHGGRLEHRPIEPGGAAFVMTLPNAPSP